MENYSVFLRAFEPGDYVLINKWRNDQAIQKMTGGMIRFVSSEMEKEWVHQKMMNNGKDLYLAICLNDDSKKMIGYLSLNNIDHIYKTADAGGTVIGDKDNQDGFAIFEAMKMLLDYAFNQLNINRITASCFPDHFLAPHSLRSLGFQKEGTMREVVYKHGAYLDMDLYSILKKDFLKITEEDGYRIMSIIKRCRNYAKNK
jgi:RimJ/RimL family protein N-acetyltransferase